MSHEANGAKERQQVLTEIRNQMEAADGSLMLDMESDFPSLRGWLLGGVKGGVKVPGGSISIQRGPYSLRVVLSWRALGLQATYDVHSWTECWESIENDLNTERVPWSEDYKQRRKAEQSWRVGGGCGLSRLYYN